MTDFTYEDMVVEEVNRQEANEAAIVPGQEAVRDEVGMAAHFDAAVTGGQAQASVYNTEVAPTAPPIDGQLRNTDWGY